MQLTTVAHPPGTEFLFIVEPGNTNQPLRGRVLRWSPSEEFVELRTDASPGTWHRATAINVIELIQPMLPPPNFNLMRDTLRRIQRDADDRSISIRPVVAALSELVGAMVEIEARRGSMVGF